MRLDPKGLIANLSAKDFAVLPAAPPGYQLIEIDENTFDGQIDRCISEPKPVLGFVIRRQQEIYFSVLPITAFSVHDDGGAGRYALIRPNGTIDYCHGGDYVFKSINELKVYLLRDGAELAREMAQDNKIPEGPAYWNRHARKLEKEAAALVEGL